MRLSSFVVGLGSIVAAVGGEGDSGGIVRGKEKGGARNDMVEVVVME